MKRKMTHLVLAAVCATLLTVLPSCKKGCYKCTKDSDTNIVCEDDYDTHQQFKDVLDYQEAFGYSCKK